MSKVFSWIVGLIPQEYKFGVAIKKASYMVGKLAAGYITASLVTKGKLTPNQCDQIQLAATTIVAGGLEAVHDWARLKWPQAAWL